MIDAKEMTIERNEVQELYFSKVLKTQQSERPSRREELIGFGSRYLCGAKPRQRLSEPTLEILSVNSQSPFNFLAASKVFTILENYVINLIDCPWKPEFRKIMMYSGFYKTQIEPFLADAYKLLHQVGFEKVGMCLELKQLPDASKLQEMAFEFFLASVECRIDAEILQRVSSSGITVSDIHDCRKQMVGDCDALTKRLIERHSIRSGKEEFPFPVPKGRGIDQTVAPITQGNSQQRLNPSHTDKPRQSEAEIGFGVVGGGTKLESSHKGKRTGFGGDALFEPENENSSDERGSESIEAMLQEITPDMVRNAKIRRQILTKLNPGMPRRDVTRASDEPYQASLPLLQETHQKEEIPSEVRPHTEPLVIPSHLKNPVEPKARMKEANIVQTHTEPLLIPKQLKRGYLKLAVQGSDPNLNSWQCAYCTLVNKPTDTSSNLSTCKSCNRPRKDA